ncbi:MAG: hypothetical protein HQL09_01405 [Nitrospirae bacterium]|nr:hypothetical protein [Nitrospirota bacterium]
MAHTIAEKTKSKVHPWRIQVISSVIGVLTGYLLFHPYTMLIHSMTKNHHNENAAYNYRDIFWTTLHAFDSEMFVMAVSFALFGGVIGLLIGILINKRRKIYEADLENEKKKIASETLQRLMITLSHHLLNANTIIGGAARRCQKLEPESEVSDFVDMIEEQSKKIDTVIGTLRKLTEIKVADYTSNGHGLMIDIAREIEKSSESKA